MLAPPRIAPVIVARLFVPKYSAVIAEINGAAPPDPMPNNAAAAHIIGSSFHVKSTSAVVTREQHITASALVPNLPEIGPIATRPATPAMPTTLIMLAAVRAPMPPVSRVVHEVTNHQLHAHIEKGEEHKQGQKPGLKEILEHVRVRGGSLVALLPKQEYVRVFAYMIGERVRMVGASGFEPPTSTSRTWRAEPDCATPRLQANIIMAAGRKYQIRFEAIRT